MATKETHSAYVVQTIRLPAKIHAKIKKRAEQEERSFTWMAMRLLQQELDAMETYKEQVPQERQITNNGPVSILYQQHVADWEKAAEAYEEDEEEIAPRNTYPRYFG